jgi:hypothetical protein
LCWTDGRIEFVCIFGGSAIAVAVHLLSPTAREAGKPTIISLGFLLVSLKKEAEADRLSAYSQNRGNSAKKRQDFA